jgi:DNA-binding NarL/FixJ family response regulator
MTPVRIVLADDHAPIRAAVRRIVEADGFVVCGEASDANTAVALAVEHSPDLCLLDIHMPGSGIAAAKAVRLRLPGTAIVMLTVSEDDDDLFDAVCAGASGYLLKGMDPARMPVALRGVLAGEAALPRTLVARLVEEFGGRRHRRIVASRSGQPDLTEREWSVLELMLEEFSTAEMAERLFIAPVTVRSHVSAILRKLQVPDRKAAVRLLRAPGGRNPLSRSTVRTNTTFGQ